jgi:hypothetical protein
MGPVEPPAARVSPAALARRASPRAASRWFPWTPARLHPAWPTPIQGLPVGSHPIARAATPATRTVTFAPPSARPLSRATSGAAPLAQAAWPGRVRLCVAATEVSAPTAPRAWSKPAFPRRAAALAAATRLPTARPTRRAIRTSTPARRSAAWKVSCAARPRPAATVALATPGCASSADTWVSLAAPMEPAHPISLSCATWGAASAAEAPASPAAQAASASPRRAVSTRRAWVWGLGARAMPGCVATPAPAARAGRWVSRAAKTAWATATAPRSARTVPRPLPASRVEAPLRPAVRS